MRNNWLFFTLIASSLLSMGLSSSKNFGGLAASIRGEESLMKKKGNG